MRICFGKFVVSFICLPVLVIFCNAVVIAELPSQGIVIQKTEKQPGIVTKLLFGDNVDLSNKKLDGFQIAMPDGSYATDVTGIKFDNSTFNDTYIDDFKFDRCSFKSADLRGLRVNWVVFDASCDFTDAVIHTDGDKTIAKTELGTIAPSLILQTASYKKHNLTGVIVDDFPFQNKAAIDFSNCDLSYAKLCGGINHIIDLRNCNLTDSKLCSTALGHITKEQLYTTQSYKKRIINNVTFNKIDLTNATLNDLKLIGCIFGRAESPISKCNFKNANLTNSDISNCDFTNAINLSIDQIKSTWNYKNNRMDGIKLPEEIPKELDTEKQKNRRVAPVDRCSNGVLVDASSEPLDRQQITKKSSAHRMINK
ncbi:MAG: pentapeptide repeat-containing protein [Planctomycetaceae bacterium]|nr:pentapeptide repeat-containing protein [Planctomycetaceae bacterium]